MTRRSTGNEGRAPLAFLAGSGEMASRMRRHDWSGTPLGPVERWPQSLRTAVGILLGSRYPMFIWWGPSLTNLYNDGYVPMLGRRHPDALGRSAPGIWSEIWSVIGPQVDGVMQQGKASWNEETLLLLERNGYLEETYFTFSYSPIPDDSGEIGGVFCAVTEETQRVIARRRLRALRSLAEATAQARTTGEACVLSAGALAADPHDLPFSLIYLLDEDSRSAHLRGSAGIAPGSAWAPLQIDRDDPHAPWPFDGVATTGESAVVRDLGPISGLLPGGPWPDAPRIAAVLPVTMSGQAAVAGFVVAGVSPRLEFADDYSGFLHLVAGQVATAVAGARAFEEEKRRAEALAELDRAKTAFFSNVSHEFRTPLTLMLGPVEDLLAGAPGSLPPAVREQLEVVDRNGMRLMRLVNTLLEFSRIEAGRVEAVYEATDLAALTADLASVFRSAIEKAGLRFVVDSPALSQRYFVDRGMWERIVLNLLSNAFKFTLSGEIALSLKEMPSGAELRVRDTGTGIAPEEMPRLFERFHRIQDARARTHEGSGIGLALVQELVRLHGGTIRAESAVDVGTSFFVSLPRGFAHLPAGRIFEPRGSMQRQGGPNPFVEEVLRWLPDPAPDEPARGAVGSSLDEMASEPLATRGPLPSSERHRVLVADDNGDMRRYIVRLLSARFDVEAAGDGVAALAAAREKPPELILTDVMMPRLDGFGLLRALREDERLRSIPVILLSARAGEESRVGGMEAGADDYLVKPFSGRELLARVEAHVKMARLRAEATRALRESEQRLQTLLDTAPAMLWLTRPDGWCTFASRGWREFTGQTFDESLGFGWLQALHPDDREEASRGYAEANTRHEPFSLVYRLRRGDGQYRWTIAAGRPRFHPDGRFSGYIGSSIDVHERRMAEIELREADRRKDEFLATLAHELRNPLAPLSNCLHLMKAAGSHEVIEKARAMMERQLQQMVRLIDDLLDLSRISRGMITLHRKRVPLAQVIQQAVETSRPTIEQLGHMLEVRLAAEPVLVDADATRLAQIFSNLLNNAAKFTPAGGRVSVVVENEGPRAAVRVRDNGVGIPPEHIDRVFDMFVQVGHSLESSGGLGIGLTLVRRLAEMHGGTVEALSDGPGHGSEFIVRLPIAAAAPGHRDEEPRLAAPSMTRLRILIVDDNHDAAQSLSLLLEMMGNETRVSGDGVEALEILPSFRPHVILLDIGMPRMNGYEAARRIREQPGGGDVLLVALTGWGQQEDRRRSQEAGFDVHLVKPVEPDALQRLLAQVSQPTA